MVERVILRCLDADPSRRPSTAISVAAALPGGDPLAAALAAGDTPSPEMVAEAGDKAAVSPMVSWSALAVFFAALIAFVALSSRTSLLGVAPLEKPPEVLAERAREILAQAGHDRKPADSLFAFEANRDYLEDLLRRPGSDAHRWDLLRATPPSGILFWYRQSPSPLAPLNGATIGGWLEDPPDSTPGMARVGLDADGRLISLLVVPDERVRRQERLRRNRTGGLSSARPVSTRLRSCPCRRSGRHRSSRIVAPPGRDRGPGSQTHRCESRPPRQTASRYRCGSSCRGPAPLRRSGRHGTSGIEPRR